MTPEDPHGQAILDSYLPLFAVAFGEKGQTIGIQYLLHHLFYAIGKDFARHRVSERAAEKYFTLTRTQWKDEPQHNRLIQSRRAPDHKLLFHEEHILTGKMFAQIIASQSGQLTLPNLTRIVQENVIAAWLLPSENLALNEAHFRSSGVPAIDGGNTLRSRIAAYSKIGIILRQE